MLFYLTAGFLGGTDWTDRIENIKVQKSRSDSMM